MRRVLDPAHFASTRDAGALAVIAAALAAGRISEQRAGELLTALAQRLRCG
jgi:hypothetical protein